MNRPHRASAEPRSRGLINDYKAAAAMTKRHLRQTFEQTTQKRAILDRESVRNNR